MVWQHTLHKPLAWMIDFLLLLFIASFVILGIRLVVDGFLHHFSGTNVDDYYQTIDNEVWKFIAKPLFACYTCMASVWGTITFFVFTGIFPITFIHPVPTWIAFCLALAFINSVLWEAYERL